MGLIDLLYEEGQTALDKEEKDGLLIPSVTTRRQLDEVEQRNIEDALRWTIDRRKRFTPEEILTEGFMRKLHARMLGDVWEWAGSFRQSNKNIGVDKFQIGGALRVLLEDCNYWIANKSFSEDEIAVRFKHRIVSIHCFANGNGRHSRLAADIIAEKIFGREVFTWGERSLMKRGDSRSRYIAALRAADGLTYEPLIAFARS